VPLDNAKLRTALRTIHAHLSPAEASAIVDVARLAAAADKKTNADEMLALLALTRIVYEMAGVTELPVPTTAIDPSRLLDIGVTLEPMGARELAFACAFIIMIQDLELTKEEGMLAGRLGEALVLEPGRANQLALQMEALVRSAKT
jgi:hypothetical protein